MMTPPDLQAWHRGAFPKGPLQVPAVVPTQRPWPHPREGRTAGPLSPPMPEAGLVVEAPHPAPCMGMLELLGTLEFPGAHSDLGSSQVFPSPAGCSGMLGLLQRSLLQCSWLMSHWVAGGTRMSRDGCVQGAAVTLPVVWLSSSLRPSVLPLAPCHQGDCALCAPLCCAAGMGKTLFPPARHFFLEEFQVIKAQKPPKGILPSCVDSSLFFAAAEDLGLCSLTPAQPPAGWHGGCEQCWSCSEHCCVAAARPRERESWPRTQQ